MIKNICDWCYKEIPEDSLHKIKIPWCNINIKERFKYITYEATFEICDSCCEKLADAALKLRNSD